MTADEITFELSGGAANSDPLLSFGGAKSGTPVEELQSTVTANQGPDKTVIFDSARIGDGDGAHVDKYVLFITGPNSLRAGRVRDFRSSDGRFRLEQRLPNTSASGNIYRLFNLNSLFHEVNALQCALGHTDYRLIYVTNTSGDLASKWQGYLRDTDTGPSWGGVDFEIFAKEDGNPIEATPANEETPPAGLDARERFTRHLAYYGTPQSQPFRDRAHDLYFGSTTWRALYLKRIVPPNQRRQPFVVGMLVVQVLDAGSAPILCGCLFPFGLLGFTPEISVSLDRGPIRTQQQIDDGYDSAIRLTHGARVAAEVRAQETGLLVPDLEIGWSIDGPGQIWTPEAPLTNSVGVAKATYSAPSDDSSRQVIAFVNSYSQPLAGRGNSSGATLSYTVAAGSERILLAMTHAGSPVDGPADLSPYGRTLSASYADLGMTLIGNAFTSSGFRIDLWFLIAPPVGLADFVYTLPGEAVATWAGLAEFSGVDQVNPLDIAPVILAEDDRAATTIVHSLTTVTDGAMLFGFMAEAHPYETFVTEDGGQTQIMQTKTGEDPPGFSGFAKVTRKLAGAAGADSIGWSSVSSGSDHVGIGIALRAALTPATITAKV